MSGGDIRCSAVIVAAGSAQRMQGIDKLLAPLDGVPVLRRTVEALASAPEITELIVVTRADRLEAVQALCEGLSKPRFRRSRRENAGGVRPVRPFCGSHALCRHS